MSSQLEVEVFVLRAFITLAPAPFGLLWGCPPPFPPFSPLRPSLSSLSPFSPLLSPPLPSALGGFALSPFAAFVVTDLAEKNGLTSKGS